VDNSDLYDPVLLRSDGTTTFFLAGTVDDIDDEVAHFVRPDVSLRLTATQHYLWQALRVAGPGSGHTPVVLRSEVRGVGRIAGQAPAPAPGCAAPATGRGSPFDQRANGPVGGLPPAREEIHGAAEKEAASWHRVCNSPNPETS